MNMKFVKKILAVTLAASLMIMPAVTAGAASTDSSEPSSSESTSTSESSGSSDSGSSTADTPAVTSTSSVPGVGKSGVGGSYSLKTIPGAAVKLTGAEIAKQANLASNAVVSVRVYEISPAGSPLAFKSINNAIAGVGGTYIGALNFDLGQKLGAKFQSLPEGVEVPVAFGVPKAFQGKKIGVIKVAKLGVTSVLEDQDDNPASVTVPVTSGLNAYAIFAY